MRVGEKEVSERAAIVAAYADLFSREQLDALRAAEAEADGDERERLYRLRKQCEAGVADTELSERHDQLENAILAERIVFEGEEMPPADRAGEACGAARVPEARGARDHASGRVRGFQRGPARAASRRE